MINRCPFCGSPGAGIVQMMPLRPGWLTVQCDRCEASGPWRLEEAAAIAAWNSRADDSWPASHHVNPEG